MRVETWVDGEALDVTLSVCDGGGEILLPRQGEYLHEGTGIFRVERVEWHLHEHVVRLICSKFTGA